MRSIPRIILAGLLAGMVLTAAPHRSTQGAGMLQILASVGGQPDDITIGALGGLLWGDLAHGTIRKLVGGRTTTVVRGLSVPEGIVVLPSGSLVVAEQGKDRVVHVARNGTSSILYPLRPVPGQDGVDGIGRDPRTGDLLIPDSPRGMVLDLSPDGRHVRVIARGLGRPVDAAVDRRGDVLVPDETLGTLVVITPGGRISREGTFLTPDDVAVDHAGRVWITTLGDGGLWTIDPGTTTPRRVVEGLADPQGLTLDRCGDPIIVDQTTAYIVRWLLTPASARCPI
ncbi:MAG TPA: hypothetical protein VNL35_08460 [Chloroflexota bacterium]|nr:hypothetical protein [Chloroflexota bacterium]